MDRDAKKLWFLINPHAGKAEIKNKALEIIDLFVKAGYEVTVHTTQRGQELPALVARHAGEYSLIVCCGGDGTLNETVDGLMRCGQRPLLGYIPAGTVNDFARSLRLSKNMLQAAQTIVSGMPFACDVGVFGERYFTYIAAFGAFTDVSYQTPQQSKNLIGRAAYIMEGIRRLPALKSYHIAAVHDHGAVEGDFLFGMVSNSHSIGGFKLLDSIDISMNDGLLEVLLVRNPRSMQEAQQLIGAILRQEFTSEFIVRLRSTTLTVDCGEEVPWTLDGEFGGAHRAAHIGTRARAIRVITSRADVKAQHFGPQAEML